jgi:hypothetical protein
MHNATKTLMHNPMQKLQTPNSINKGIQNLKGQGSISRNIGNIGVKHKYFSTHKNMVKAIERNTQLLMHSMDRMQECTHESNLVIKEKRSKTQKGIVDKQLDYFKCKDKITNGTQMIMVNASTSLANIIKEILKGDKGKEPFFPTQNFDAHIKEDAQ